MSRACLASLPVRHLLRPPSRTPSRRCLCRDCHKPAARRGQALSRRQLVRRPSHNRRPSNRRPSNRRGAPVARYRRARSLSLGVLGHRQRGAYCSPLLGEAAVRAVRRVEGVSFTVVSHQCHSQYHQYQSQYRPFAWAVLLVVASACRLAVQLPAAALLGAAALGTVLWVRPHADAHQSEDELSMRFMEEALLCAHSIYRTAAKAS